MTNRWANPINNNILQDLEGTVLASGSVAFYIAGTSTPLAVYSDPELSVSLGSFINADAFGLLPDFHLASGTQYKMVAYDAVGGAGGAGAVKWTRDDVFGLDSAVDTRLDSLESTLDALDVADNFVINGGMRVASAAAVTATASYLEGQVLDVFGKVANVTAGTMAQAQDDDYVSGYTSAFSGVSTDNAAATVDAQFRIQSKDCFGLINQPAVFFCQVEHNVGSAINYTVTVSTANAVDDFSVITTILAGSAVSVASGTKTRLELSVADLGDVSNGIAITISAACGIVTTKEFKIGESQLQKGASASAFSELPYDVVYAALNAVNEDYVNTTVETTIDDFAKREAGQPWLNGIGAIDQLTGSGNWTVPAGVYRVKATLIGGGGGGAWRESSVSTNGGSGGDTTFGAVIAAKGSGAGVGARTSFAAATTGSGGAVVVTSSTGAVNFLTATQCHGVGGGTPLGFTNGFVPPLGYGTGGNGFSDAISGETFYTPGGRGGETRIAHINVTPGASVGYAVGAGGTSAGSAIGTGEPGTIILEW